MLRSEHLPHAVPYQTFQNGALCHAGAIRVGFAQFAAFGQDTIDNRPISLRASSPCLCWRLEAKRRLERRWQHVAADVQEAIVADSGDWIMEENPAATTKLVTNFLKSSR
jgi:hypothetical protein